MDKHQNSSILGQDNASPNFALRGDHSAWLLAWLPLLVGLQGVPHTGALRTLLLLMGIAHLFWLQRLNRHSMPFHQEGWPEKLAFSFLTVWLVLQSSLIATDPHASLNFLVSDWGKLVLLILVGVWLVRVVSDKRWIVVSLFAGAYLHVISTLMLQVISLAKGNGLVYHDSLLCEYPVASSFATAALAWLLADLMARHGHGQSIFPWRARHSVMLGITVLLAEAVLKAKSGQAMDVVLISVSCLWLIRRHGVRHPISLGILAVAVTVLATIFLIGENRWQGIDVSLSAALNQPIPVEALASDLAPIPEGVSHSFYMRAVRGRAGIEGIMEHPWGLGFGPDIFRRYVALRYGATANDSSNSGLIDFALANGLIGLGLLLTLASILIWRGWQAFKAQRNEGLVLAFLIFIHIGRYTLDGTMSGSRFTLIGLVGGVVWALSRRRNAAVS